MYIKSLSLTVLLITIFELVFFPTYAHAKGGFFVLDGGSNGRDGVTGGSVVVDWRDFEPEEGNYQWDLIDNPTGLFVPWIAYWKTHMCQMGSKDVGDCTKINTAPQRTPGQFLFGSSGATTVRFKLRVTEGALPLWIFGGEGEKEKALGLGPNHDGKIPNSTGGTICACINYCYMPGEPQCHPDTDIALASAYPLYPSKEDNAHPVWWNPIFQQKLHTTLLALGRRIESNPEITRNIEFVEASVGNFGEMILYGKSETGWAFCNNKPDFHTYEDCVCKADRNLNKNKQSCPASMVGKNYFCTYDYVTTHIPDGVRKWLESGYTNKKYYDAVMNILGFYVESFKKLPIALSEGTGLYAGDPYIYRSDCSTIAVDDQDHYPYVMSKKVIPDALAKWGSKIYLKFAGFGAGGGHGGGFRDYCPNKTRCIYESYGGIANWPGWPWGGDHSQLEQIFQYGVDDKAYIIMMWYADWRVITLQYPTLEQAFKDIAPKLKANGAILPTPPTDYASVTPTPSPIASSLYLATGKNKITWQQSYPANSTFLSLPNECSSSGRLQGNYWQSFRKLFGGFLGTFLSGDYLSIHCASIASWDL